MLSANGTKENPTTLKTSSYIIQFFARAKV